MVTYLIHIYWYRWRIYPWAGSVLENINREDLVVDPDRVEEAVKRLSRVGIDNTKGFLEGGIEV